MNWWLLFISVHAVAGLSASVTGVMMLSPRRAKRWPWLIPLFVWSLVVLIIGMVSAMASHWTGISRMEQIIYSGLVLLAAYMVYRALLARYKLLSQPSSNGYIDDVGFPLISLFNGFTIVALIDLHTPAWLIAGSAIAAALIGERIIRRAKANSQPAAGH